MELNVKFSHIKEQKTSSTLNTNDSLTEFKAALMNSNETNKRPELPI